MAINWERVPNFSPGEFPENPDEFADPQLIYTLQRFRTLHGEKVWPSPADGALARVKAGRPTSLHYTDPDKGKYSKAVDFFCDGCPVMAFLMLMAKGPFHRFGVYFDKQLDGKPWVMFHGDLKGEERGLFWYTDKRGAYHYPLVSRAPKEFGLLMALLKEHVNRVKTR